LVVAEFPIIVQLERAAPEAFALVPIITLLPPLSMVEAALLPMNMLSIPDVNPIPQEEPMIQQEDALVIAVADDAPTTTLLGPVNVRLPADAPIITPFVAVAVPPSAEYPMETELAPFAVAEPPTTTD
jgi:hypothetical protein